MPCQPMLSLLHSVNGLYRQLCLLCYANAASLQPIVLLPVAINATVWYVADMSRMRTRPGKLPTMHGSSHWQVAHGQKLSTLLSKFLGYEHGFYTAAAQSLTLPSDVETCNQENTSTAVLHKPLALM